MRAAANLGGSDRSDNTYLMVKLETPTFRNGWDDVSVEYGVLVFDHTAVLHHRFAIKVGDSGFQWSTSSPSLTVNDNNKVLVLGKRRILSGYCQSVVDVFETDGQFVRTFGEGILMNASDITAGNEGQVMVVDGEDHVFVHVFSEQGEHLLKEKLSKFEVGGILDHKIAFHPASEHVIVASIETRKRYSSKGRPDGHGSGF